MRVRLVAGTLVLWCALAHPAAALAQDGGFSFWDGWLEKMSGPLFEGREFYVPVGCLQSDRTVVNFNGQLSSDVVATNRLVQPWSRYNFDDRELATRLFLANFVASRPSSGSGSAAPVTLGATPAVTTIDVTIKEPAAARTCLSVHAHFARATKRNEVASDVYSRSVELRASWALVATKQALELGTGAGLYEIGDQARFRRRMYTSAFAVAKPGRLFPDGSGIEKWASLLRFEGGARLFWTSLKSSDISVLIQGQEFDDHNLIWPTFYAGASIDLTEFLWPWKKSDSPAYRREIK